MQRGEPTQARHEPPDREGGRSGNGEDTDPVLVSDALTGKQDAVQPSACAFEKSPTIDRQLNAAMKTSRLFGFSTTKSPSRPSAAITSPASISRSAFLKLLLFSEKRVVIWMKPSNGAEEIVK